jgi:hypothetical protein
MGWPQVTMIALLAMSVGISIAKHGESRPPFSAWAAMINAGISSGLLYAGGFFN